MDAEKLNEDQRRGIKSLPGLEAVQKELGEVKKAIEVRISPLQNLYPLSAPLIRSTFNCPSSRYHISVSNPLATYMLPRNVALTQNTDVNVKPQSRTTKPTSHTALPPNASSPNALKKRVSNPPLNRPSPTLSPALLPSFLSSASPQHSVRRLSKPSLQRSLQTTLSAQSCIRSPLRSWAMMKSGKSES